MEKMMTTRKQLFLLLTLVLFISLVVACGGGGSDADTPPPTPTARGDAEAGQTAYTTTCVACHGPEAKGVTGLGKDLTTSEFVATKTDDELADFVKTGRPSTDPLNTTGIDMPPKGGNPALTDDDIYNIVAFLRSIHVQP
jgi:disulfide bond formation protein DsbB